MFRNLGFLLGFWCWILEWGVCLGVLVVCEGCCWWVVCVWVGGGGVFCFIIEGVMVFMLAVVCACCYRGVEIFRSWYSGSHETVRDLNARR